MVDEVIQCYDGDGVEPPKIRQERLEKERVHRERVETVGVRLLKRQQREKNKKVREKRKPIVRCERFEMRSVGNKTHFQIKSREHPEDLIFFAGDRFKEMTFRYPAHDDVRTPMRMPVVLRFLDAKVLQMHSIERDGGFDADADLLYYEISITVQSDTLYNDSQKVYKAFRESICLPIGKEKHGSLQPGQVASSKDRGDQDLPQRPRQHRRKSLVRSRRT